jgi:hypothetical protein
VAALLFSSAHCCFAPSICRKLLLQLLYADVVRARINHADNPMAVTRMKARMTTGGGDIFVLFDMRA